jgi:hypothetical protein
MPVWGVWIEQSAWFSGSLQSRKTRNLAENPNAVITTDNALQPVVVQGVVERITHDSLIASFTQWVNEKYETDYPVSFFSDNACFRLHPVWAFSLDEDDFTGSPTRWIFDA